MIRIFAIVLLCFGISACTDMATETSQFIMPDVVGLTFDAAKAKVEGHGQALARANSTRLEPAGTVWAQQPKKGYVFTRPNQRLIILHVSAGPPVSMTEMPSVIGALDSAAETKIRSAGLVPNHAGGPTRAVPIPLPGCGMLKKIPVVGGQTPDAGTPVPAGHDVYYSTKYALQEVSIGCPVIDRNGQPIWPPRQVE